MLINLNGWPGSGKLTVGRLLAARLEGRLLHNHSIIEAADRVAQRGTPGFYETARAKRESAFQEILGLPATCPVVLTNVVARGTASGYSEENWLAIRKLAELRGCALYAIRLYCTPEENHRRLASADRAEHGKMQDSSALEHAMSAYTLFDDGADCQTSIDNTRLSPDACAAQILAWLKEIES